MTTANGSSDQMPLAALCESLLFVADEPVPVRRLAQAMECHVDDVEQALAALAEDYERRGLRLQRKGERVQLVSTPQAASCIERFLALPQSSKLSTAALEALAIIAFKQPITRPEIESIRGVSSDGVLRTLVRKGLVEEVGRSPTVGHPTLYGTTFEFLQYFGLTSLGELPPLEEVRGENEDEQGTAD